MSDGNNALLIGVTIADTDANTISAVLMTVEGIVLLDAEYKDNRVAVNRSVPSFDSAEFSTGLLIIVRLIYLVSCRDAVESGTSDSIFIERYKCCDGNIIDISANDGSIDIHKYNSGKKLSRRAHLSKINKEGIRDRLK